MKQTAITVFCFLLFCSVPLFAQSDTDILSISVGNLFAYDLDAGDLGTARELSLGFGLSDRMEAGFHFYQGDGLVFADYALFSLSYAAGSLMGLDLFTGARTSLLPAGSSGLSSGLGYYLNLFAKEFDQTLSTILKLRVHYLMTEGIAPEKGMLLVSLAGKIAF